MFKCRWIGFVLVIPLFAYVVFTTRASGVITVDMSGYQASNHQSVPLESDALTVTRISTDDLERKVIFDLTQDPASFLSLSLDGHAITTHTALCREYRK